MLIFLKSCRLRQPDRGLPYQWTQRRAGPVRARSGGIVTSSSSVEAELLVQRGALRSLGHELVEVGAGPEVVADAPDDEHLHVVVDARLEDEVAVAAAGRRSSSMLSWSGRLIVIVAMRVLGSFS